MVFNIPQTKLQSEHSQLITPKVEDRRQCILRNFANRFLCQTNGFWGSDRLSISFSIVDGAKFYNALYWIKTQSNFCKFWSAEGLNISL